MAHPEIYLSDPRRVAPARIRTIPSPLRRLVRAFVATHVAATIALVGAIGPGQRAVGTAALGLVLVVLVPTLAMIRWLGLPAPPPGSKRRRAFGLVIVGAVALFIGLLCHLRMTWRARRHRLRCLRPLPGLRRHSCSVRTAWRARQRPNDAQGHAQRP